MAGYWIVQPYRPGATVQPGQRSADFGEVIARVCPFRNMNPREQVTGLCALPGERRMSAVRSFSSASRQFSTAGVNPRALEASQIGEGATTTGTFGMVRLMLEEISSGSPLRRENPPTPTSPSSGPRHRPVLVAPLPSPRHERCAHALAARKHREYHRG